MNLQNKSTIHIVFLILVFVPSQAFGFQAWWQCQSRKGGEWVFARAPSVCLVDHMQTQSFVKQQYVPIIFDDSRSRTSERSRYMTEMHALAKEVAQYYLQRRKPAASAAEKEAFSRGLLALMHQETLWSHYRKNTDGKIRYMRGDNGHGHGIMQVDDRSHQSALLDGKGADLINNMIYGLDVFFSAWQKAPSQSCVGGPTNYIARIRSAWSAYNGGPARICRWVSKTGTFAHHDTAFLKKLTEQSWTSYISNNNHQTSLDVPCLAEGARPCAGGKNKPDDEEGDEPVQDQLYKTQENNYCVLKNKRLECVDRLNDVNCLQLREQKLYTNISPLPFEFEDSTAKFLLDRQMLCADNVKGLIPLTKNIELQVNINLRKTPGGEWLAQLDKGQVYKVLDFAVTTTDSEKRYYKVQANGVSGFIYAGNSQSYNDWVMTAPLSSPEKPPVSLIANPGENIEVVAPNGINLRQTPGGTRIGYLARWDQVEVLDSVVRGSKNYLYYRVQNGSEVGFIYSGYLDNGGTVASWTRVLDKTINPSEYKMLKTTIAFRFLKACPKQTCAFSGSVAISRAISPNPDQWTVEKRAGDWSYVRDSLGVKKGWILTRELVSFEE